MDTEHQYDWKGSEGNDQQGNDQPPAKPSGKKYNTWIYLGIIGLLLITNGILFFQKNAKEKEIVTVTEVKDQAVLDRDNIQQEYNASLARLDDLTSENSKLRDQINERDTDLAKTKARIQAILNNKNATDKELHEAQNLIHSLNTKIAGYEEEIASLKQENAGLSSARDSLTYINTHLEETNEGLAQQVNLGKILHASNIRITGIALSRSGRKEKEVSRAKRVDVLRITFDIDENRLTDDGTKDLQIRIINPMGSLLSNAALGSGSFVEAENKQQVLYSLSKKVKLKNNQPVKNIVADWQQSAEYEKGGYTVEIYNQGYLIGRGIATLR